MNTGDDGIADGTCIFYVIVYSITMTLALTGIFSGLCTFYLIWRLKLSNYYISIIKWLTACMLAYDVSFFLGPFSYGFQIAAQVLADLGGIATTLWVNLICFEVIETSCPSSILTSLCYRIHISTKSYDSPACTTSIQFFAVNIRSSTQM